MKKPPARNARDIATQNSPSVREEQAYSLPPALAAIAAGRDHILTEEFAKATGCRNQTVRKNVCLRGECFGVRPLKCGNRLLWPLTQIAALLNGDIPPQGAARIELPQPASGATVPRRRVSPTAARARAPSARRKAGVASS
jgi:hypothetical protein